jgi:hypothetical protein
MSAAKRRFERVSLEDLKKILPEQALGGDHNDPQTKKKKDKRRGSETSSSKSKA